MQNSGPYKKMTPLGFAARVLCTSAIAFVLIVGGFSYWINRLNQRLEDLKESLAQHEAGWVFDENTGWRRLDADEPAPETN